MPYLTGGYGNGSFQFNSQTTGGSPTDDANTRAGGAYIGGGLDWAALNNWILGVEYRHYFFSAAVGNSTYTGAGGGEPIRFAPTTDTVMARLSYKFDWKPIW
jgi:outer membrane immunogenic protein